MFGIDISNHQKGIDLTKGKYDFCIIKATEGFNFVDPSFYSFAIQLTKMGKLMGCYHFARPDLHPTEGGMKEEADNFCSHYVSAGLQERAIAILDWETEPMYRPELIYAWISQVKTRLGIPSLLYASRPILKMLTRNTELKDVPLWMAMWPNTVKYESGENPRLATPTTNFEWKIWQYSSIGRYPTYAGNVDLDWCRMSQEEWKSMAGSCKKEEELSEDMKWAIDIGLFKGYSNSTYSPEEPLTRNQAASLFRRYYKYTQK